MSNRNLGLLGGAVLVILALIFFALSASQRNAEEEAIEQLTAAAATAALYMTQTEEARPTETETPTETVTPTVTATTSPTLGVTSTVGAPAVSSCDQAAFVADVTIPDGTEIQAGATFTKTWELRNAGTCTWTSAYTVVFYSDNRMGAPASAQLTATDVPPGGNVQISMNMTAPTTPGTVYSYWLLRNAAGQNFGVDAFGNPFYVQIVVIGGGPTATGATATPTTGNTTATASVTPSPTDEP
jgi:hypothetical protein